MCPHRPGGLHGDVNQNAGELRVASWTPYTAGKNYPRAHEIGRQPARHRTKMTEIPLLLAVLVSISYVKTPETSAYLLVKQVIFSNATMVAHTDNPNRNAVSPPKSETKVFQIKITFAIKKE